jgi:hypothetical protein
VITHVVSFRWKPETTPDQVAAISAALATMPGIVPTIATYRFGTDLGANGTANMDFAIIATFASIEDWRAYDEHPEHDRVRSETVRPWIAERASVQFQS